MKRCGNGQAFCATATVRSGSLRSNWRTTRRPSVRAPACMAAAAITRVAQKESGQASTPARASAPPTERMFLQIGAFADAENAERLVARLRASGFANTSVVSAPTDTRRLHRVWLGPIRDAAEFDRVDTRLRAIGVSGSRLVVDRTQ